MNHDRIAILLQQILADLSAMNIGPAQPVPVRTIWIRASKRGGVTAGEMQAVLAWAIDIDVLAFSPGGVLGWGSVALTDYGYGLAIDG